jgi:phosphatidylglycerophosphate synthase
VSTIQPPEVRPADEPASKVAPPRIELAALLGLLATAVLLGVVSATAGLGLAGWITGLVTGSAAAGLLVAARRRSDHPAILPAAILPADWVTLTRLMLIAGVTGLVAGSFSRPLPVTALVTLSAVALALDAVDGQVARRTGTATPLGARIDGEADAFLILVLSVAVSRDYGGWVLAIGAARYAFLVAGWLFPWLRAPLGPRFWRKVVAAVQGIVLTVAISGVTSRAVGLIAVAVALVLLAESFGRDVLWLYRAGAGARTRRAARVTVAAVAFLVLWFALVAPDRIWQFSPGAFVRIPVELLVLVAVAVFLPPWPRRIVAAVAGLLITLLTVAKVLNIAYYDEVDRAFNPVSDWVGIGQARGVIRDSVGSTVTNIVTVAIVIGLVLLLAAGIAATFHVTAVAARHRHGAVRGVAALAAVWGVSAGLALQVVPGMPVASASATGLAAATVQAARAGFADPRVFEAETRAPDPEATVPAASLLTGLRGKDVIIAVVESYGQTAIQGTSFSPGIDSVLKQRSSMLASAGWSAQSAWLTSPTFGGISWLAHSTLQSGLWVDSNQRYNELLDSQRFTLSDAFKKAGWHTAEDDPADNTTWTPGTTFYHYDDLFDKLNVGYEGPRFSFSTMPDQYTLSAFQHDELAPGHQPVMAEINLTTSHIPWAPLPTIIPWNQVGNGSEYYAQHAASETSTQVWQSNNTVKQFYGKSIQYSMTALTSWVTELNDPNLVLIVFGDHQPHTAVSGTGATHSVPISVITRAPSVLQQISSWHWQNGLIPAPSAPLEPMDAFRNQFLNTFNSKGR